MGLYILILSGCMRWVVFLINWYILIFNFLVVEKDFMLIWFLILFISNIIGFFLIVCVCKWWINFLKVFVFIYFLFVNFVWVFLCEFVNKLYEVGFGFVKIKKGGRILFFVFV